MNLRIDGRKANELRPIKLVAGIQKSPAGSVLIEWGDTKVICSATVEEKLPKWMSPHEKKGWITAEYNMLPASSDQRIPRDRARNSGRTQEIQRLIGRSLRAAVPLNQIGPRSIQIDCDVLQADGGTRVASITGSFLALRQALHRLVRLGLITHTPQMKQVAAVSVGRVKGEIFTDLNYAEDSKAELDANIVMNEDLQFIELQGTAENGSFSKAEWDQLLEMATESCKQIFTMQQQAMKKWEIDSFT